MGAIALHSSRVTGIGGEATTEAMRALLRIAERAAASVPCRSHAAAGMVVEAIKTSCWDVAFLARDFRHEAVLAFSSSYLAIEGSYCRLRSKGFASSSAEVRL